MQFLIFFDKNEEYKKKFELAPYTDPLLRGQKKNRGYMPQQEKEYLKIRLKDDEKEYPPEVLEGFRKTMEYLYEVAYLGLMRLSQGPDPDSPPFKDDLFKAPHPKTVGGTNSKYEKGKKKEENVEDEKRWIPETTFKSVRDFIPEGSSMSVIRYFKMDTADESMNCPCDEHYDTGIVTMILISEVPGLQVLDQSCGKWLDLEKLGTPGDLVMIMGRKMDLLKSENAKLKPTFHRVNIPRNVMRHSILFFMDLPAGPDKD